MVAATWPVRVFRAHREMACLLCTLVLLAHSRPSISAEAEGVRAQASAESAEKPPAVDQVPWQPLFDGKSLDGWQITRFGGEGQVYVEDDRIRLDFGSALTGITYQKEIPRIDYEIALEAQRIDGTDFFCGLTFPVRDAYCSLIVGGWGGALVGLSSIDGMDASENATQTMMAFTRGKWYAIRVRVTAQQIVVWIDDKQIIQQPLEGHELSIRPEVHLSRPLGLAAWETRAALRNIRLRPVKD